MLRPPPEMIPHPHPLAKQGSIVLSYNFGKYTLALQGHRTRDMNQRWEVSTVLRIRPQKQNNPPPASNCPEIGKPEQNQLLG